MARPLRIEFAGALYHVTARGDRQEDIFLDDTDRHDFLSTLEQVCIRFNWLVHAYCLMDNHYHLLIETPDQILVKVCVNSMVCTLKRPTVRTGR